MATSEYDLAAEDGSFAFSDYVMDEDELATAEILLRYTAPGPSWAVTARKQRAAVAVACVPDGHLAYPFKIAWMKKLAAAAEGDSWVAVVEEFQAMKRAAKESCKGGLVSPDGSGGFM